MKRHPWLAALFAFGTTICGLTTALLLWPGTRLDQLWRLNPEAQAAFSSLGKMSILLMAAVGLACGSAALGLWRGRRWGVRVAIIILSINLVGDVLNALIRHDYRALIGIPIGGAMIIYLARSQSENR